MGACVAYLSDCGFSVLLFVYCLFVCLFSQVVEWSQSLITLSGRELIRTLRDTLDLMIALQNLLKVHVLYV